MLPGQLSLFPELAPPSSSIAGLQLKLPSPCHCGCSTVVIGSSKAMHHAAIRCSQCGVHRGWISRAESDRISTIVSNSSNRPTEPIAIGTAR